MVTVRMKSLFFDSPKVIRAVDKAKRQVLSKSGAVIRTIARRSMRPARQYSVTEMPEEMRESYERRAKIAKQAGLPRPKRPKAPSKPGEPPRVRLGHLKRLLFYAYDPQRESVVVGPERFRKGQAPSVLEEGGTATVTGFEGGKIVRRRIRVKPRPYMGPALEKERPRLPLRWRNSVRG
jgi:hypothetical protein